MIRELAKSIREYKKVSIMTPILVSMEVVMECLIPFIIANLVNQIKAGCEFQVIAVYGLVLVLMAGISLLFGAWAGNTLSLIHICILPTIVRTTEESLLAVPGSYKEGAMALGAGKLRVILGIVLPCAVPGILTAVILAMGRIVGESAALLYTSGMSYNMPKDFFGQIMNSGRTLTLHLYQTAMQATSDDAFHIAFATAAVLLVIVFLLNLLAGLVSKTLKKGEQ